MIRKIIIAAGFWLPISLQAQNIEKEDSLKGAFLQTVFITCNNCNTNFNGRRYDGQARTERLLDNLPGVNLISRGNFAQEPVIRGMSDGQINVTINGMHMFGACTDRMDPVTSYVEPNNMKSLQVSTGPGFGNGGASVGGGLNFNLRQAQANDLSKWSGMVGTGFETNAFARQFLGSIQYSSKQVAFSLDGVYRKAGDYTPGGNKNKNIEQYGQWTPQNGFSINEKGRINFSQYQKLNAHANMLYRLNERHSLVADYLQDDGKNIGYPALTMDVAFAKTKMGSITHEYINNSKALYSWQSKMYYNDIDHAMDDTRRPKEEVPMHMDMPGHSLTGGAYTQLYWKVSSSQLIKAKLETYLNRWHASMTMYPDNGGNEMYMLTIPDAQRTVAGMDISDEIYLGNRWLFSSGLHAEYNRSSVYTSLGRATLTSIYSGNPDNTKWLYNAFVQLGYRPLSPVGFDVKLARGMRAPTLKEAYAFYLYNRVDGYDYLGNPAIREEASYNGEVNLWFTNKKIRAEVKGFSYWFQNYIAGFVQQGYSPMTAGANGVKQYGNISSAHIVGMSLLVNWKLSNKIYFNSNTSWQEGKDNNNNYLPMMPSLKSVNTIRYVLNNWRFFAEGIGAASQNNVSAFYGETLTPGFFIADAGVDKKIRLYKNQFILSVTCNNIFNKYYYEHLDVIQLPREGRNFIIHATYNF